MACLTHTDLLYRCPWCGECVIMHPVEMPHKQAVMGHNLMMALRDRRKLKDGENYTARANEYARWLEVKENG